MKPNTIHQEILLVTTTTFSRKQLCEKKEFDCSQLLSPVEQLEKACWDGLLDELLPEIMKRTFADQRLYIWRISHNGFCLQIELSECPVLNEKQSANNFCLPLQGIFYN